MDFCLFCTISIIFNLIIWYCPAKTYAFLFFFTIANISLFPTLFHGHNTWPAQIFHNIYVCTDRLLHHHHHVSLHHQLLTILCQVLYTLPCLQVLFYHSQNNLLETQTWSALLSIPFSQRLDPCKAIYVITSLLNICYRFYHFYHLSITFLIDAVIYFYCSYVNILQFLVSIIPGRQCLTRTKIHVFMDQLSHRHHPVS